MKRHRNPDDDALLRRLVVTVDDNPHHAHGKRGNYKWLVAMDGERPVATMFVKMARKYAYAKDVAVWVEYRRRGVASWLYRWVERKYGVKVIHSKDQTTDGKAFARGRRRNPIVVETPTEKQRRLWLKYSEIVEIDAAKFKDLFERHRGEKLAWNSSRSEAAMGRPTFNGYPIVYVDKDRLTVDVEDGRHRINEAARRGVPIQVACRRGIGKLLERLGIATRRGNPDDRELLARLKFDFIESLSEPGLWTVVARDGSMEIANADVFVKQRKPRAALVNRGGGRIIRGEVIEVLDSYKRRGVASAMVREIEKMFGGEVFVPPGEFSWEGQNFWTGRRKNPDDKELLSRLSLALEHHGRRRIGDGRTLPVVEVKIYDGSRQVGAFLFIRVGDAVEAVDAYVNPSVRRRGVASWVYREVGRHFGTTVRHSKLQLEAGRAFARGRRR